MLTDSCDWPWWIMFAAVMVSSYFREMRLRRERNDPRCTLFYTYQPATLKIGSPSLIITVRMNSLLPIITRSIIGINEFINTYY